MKSVALLILAIQFSCIFAIDLKQFLSIRSHARDSTNCYTRPVPVPLPNPLPQELQNAFEEAGNIVTQIAQQQGTVGTSVIIVYNQTTIWEFGYGSANKSIPDNVPTSDTIFR
jgi:hypothetical protein